MFPDFHPNARLQRRCITVQVGCYQLLRNTHSWAALERWHANSLEPNYLLKDECVELMGVALWLNVRR
jgi:hypothetical protein